jgi:hypothetical protein
MINTAKVVHKTTKIPGPLLKPLPQRAYDRTNKENKVISDAQVTGHFAPKQPEAKQTFSEKDKNWAMGMLTQPAQYKMNLPSDYDHEISKQSVLSDEKKTSAKAGNNFPSSENRRINRSPAHIGIRYR